MKIPIVIAIVLSTFWQTTEAQSEADLCRRLFVSAGVLVQEADIAVDLAAQAVWGASEFNGYALTLTGTLTQTDPVMDTWTYSSSPTDKLVLQFSGAVPMEIVFLSFNGYLQGTWEEFTDDHSIDFTFTAGSSYALRIQSQSVPHSTEYKYTWSRHMAGVLPSYGEATTVDLTHSGMTTYEISGGYAFHDYEEQCTGSYSSPSSSTTVNDQYFALIRHNSNQGMFVSNKGITTSSSTTVGGNTYAYQNGTVRWAAYTNLPDSANAGVYNKVLDAYYWQAGGTLTKNGVPHGTVAFDRAVIDNSTGPLLVLQTTGGPSYLLHPLLNSVVTEVRPIASELPASIELHENFPNPFNPGTIIQFELSTSALVSLEVFDALGRRVSTLVSDVLPAGRHQVRWDASGFPSGIYWSRIQAQGEVHSSRMVLVR